MFGELVTVFLDKSLILFEHLHLCWRSVPSAAPQDEALQDAVHVQSVPS